MTGRQHVLLAIALFLLNQLSADYFNKRTSDAAQQDSAVARQHDWRKLDHERLFDPIAICLAEVREFNDPTQVSGGVAKLRQFSSSASRRGYKTVAHRLKNLADRFVLWQSTGQWDDSCYENGKPISLASLVQGIEDACDSATMASSTPSAENDHVFCDSAAKEQLAPENMYSHNNKLDYSSW